MERWDVSAHRKSMHISDVLTMLSTRELCQNTSPACYSNQRGHEEVKLDELGTRRISERRPGEPEEATVTCNTVLRYELDPTGLKGLRVFLLHCN